MYTVTGKLLLRLKFWYTCREMFLQEPNEKLRLVDH